MRTATLLSAVLLALTHTIAAQNNADSAEIELYPDSEDCTGRKIVITERMCQNQLIRGSAKVIKGGTWGFYGADCTSQAVGVMTKAQGCFTTYPGYFSWRPVIECLGCGA